MEEIKQYNTAIYLRLSKGDGDVDGIEKSESNSISNQRLITERFLEEHSELILVDTYIDDGYTGTNYKRPEFKRLMYDIDDGRIDCVVVKDLSRFGRERIETGNYISKIFKEKGVRFIAINDHYDSLTADGSETHLIMPIKALTNDNYSRDISLKVRSSFSVKRSKGECIASFAPYGYQKDPENVNHLIIDEVAAKVVQKIFARKIEGVSANAIAEELNEAGVLCPGDYKRKQGIKVNNPKKQPGKTKWSAIKVLRILKNEAYIGNMVQGRTEKVSYKVNKVIHKAKEDWDIVEGTHEAIIRKADFEIVQSLLQRDTIRSGESTEGYLFSGLLFCGDCGKSMRRRKRKNKKGESIHYICSSYNSKSSCSSHDIAEETLAEIVLASMNQMIQKLCQYDELAKNLERLEVHKEDAISQDDEIKALKEELQKYHSLKTSLYQDLQEGLLTEAQFEKYRQNYTIREQELQDAIQAQKNLIQKIYENGVVADSILQQFQTDPQIKELNHRLLVSLIDKILIYEDHRIEIVYRYTNEIKKCQEILVKAGKEVENHGKEQ